MPSTGSQLLIYIGWKMPGLEYESTISIFPAVWCRPHEGSSNCKKAFCGPTDITVDAIQLNWIRSSHMSPGIAWSHHSIVRLLWCQLSLLKEKVQIWIRSSGTTCLECTVCVVGISILLFLPATLRKILIEKVCTIRHGYEADRETVWHLEPDVVWLLTRIWWIWILTGSCSRLSFSIRRPWCCCSSWLVRTFQS